MRQVQDQQQGLSSVEVFGATGADIRAICTEAGMWAIREERDSVTLADFERAVEKVVGEEELRKESVTMFA